MPGLDGYRKFLKDLDRELDRVGAAAARRSAPRGSGCSDCRGPVFVLPIEAHAILRSSAGCSDWHPHPSSDERCPFLSAGSTCEIHSVRPFSCRTGGLQLEMWNERLNKLNADFCAAWNLSTRRISLEALLSAARADDVLAAPALRCACGQGPAHAAR